MSKQIVPDEPALASLALMKPTRYFEESKDPKQVKTLTKIQKFLNDTGSKFGVVPSNLVLNEFVWMRQMKDEMMRQTSLLEEAIGMLETPRLLKALSKARDDEDKAFKFT